MSMSRVLIQLRLLARPLLVFDLGALTATWLLANNTQDSLLIVGAFLLMISALLCASIKSVALSPVGEEYI
jgi:hypothetical protein